MDKDAEIKRLNEKIEFLARTNMLYSDWEHRETQVTSDLIRKGIEEAKINAELRAEIERLKDVSWGVDWGKAGDTPCATIVRRLLNGGFDAVDPVQNCPIKHCVVGFSVFGTSWAIVWLVHSTHHFLLYLTSTLNLVEGFIFGSHSCPSSCSMSLSMWFSAIICLLFSML